MLVKRSEKSSPCETSVFHFESDGVRLTSSNNKLLISPCWAPSVCEICFFYHPESFFYRMMLGWAHSNFHFIYSNYFSFILLFGFDYFVLTTIIIIIIIFIFIIDVLFLFVVFMIHFEFFIFIFIYFCFFIFILCIFWFYLIPFYFFALDSFLTILFVNLVFNILSYHCWYFNLLFLFLFYFHC